MKKKVIKRSIIFSVFAAIFLIVYVYLTEYALISIKTASVFTIIITAAVSYSGLILSDFIKQDKLRRFFKGTAAAIVVIFAAEVFIFNFKSFTSNNATYYTDFSAFKTDNSDAIEIKEDKIILNEDGSFEVELENDEIRAVRLEFSEIGEKNKKEKSKKDTNEIKCSLNIKDDNFSHRYIRVAKKALTAEYGKCDFSFNPYGTLHSLKFEIENLKKPVELTSILFNKALPFKFYELRFYALLLIFAVVYAIRVFEFYKVIYDRKNIKHKLLLVSVTVMCSAFMLCLLSPADKTIKYSDNMALSTLDPYTQMFDAFHKGQLNFDIDPTDSFLELDNPYDLSEREEKSVYYEWDRAFYDGKYYSYFGVSPVFIFYYPFYFISRGRLPSLNLTSVIFGIITIVLMSGAIMAFIKRFIKKPNLLLVLMGLAASGFMSGMYFNVHGTSIYTMQEIFGVCFLMGCLWSGAEACGKKGKKLQPVLFALSGLSFVICVAAKPTIALCALIIAPLFLETLFSREMKLKAKLVSVACFIVPIILGMAGIMWYNNARFDSPFQFGAIYQLTVSNVSANSVKLSGIPYAILHYFLQPVHLDSSFPFVKMWPLIMENTENYVYSDWSAGVFTFPYIFAAFCGLPFLLHYLKRKKGEKLLFSDKQLRKHTYILIVLISVLISWITYCVAGVILRYVCDILPIITIMSILVLLDIQQQTVSHKAISGRLTCAISLVSVFTIVLVFLEILSIQDFMLQERFPNIIYAMEDMICFWN